MDSWASEGEMRSPMQGDGPGGSWDAARAGAQLAGAAPPAAQPLCAAGDGGAAGWDASAAMTK